MGVNVVKLDDVCEFYRGLTYSKKDEATFSNKIVLRASNIDLNTSTLDFEDLKYLKDDFNIPNDKKLQKDCIFICMSSGSKSHLGKVAYINKDYDYAFGGFMGLIKPKQNILPRYLFYLLQTPEYKELINKLSNGININNIKFSDLKEFQFELPSLEEQEKALIVLDKADEIRIKKRLANDKLDEFLKSIFIDMFGDTVKNEKNFKKDIFGTGITTLSDYHANGSYKILRQHVELLLKPNYALMIRTTDLENKNYIDGVNYITEKAYNFLEKSKIYGGEIIINKIGSAGKVYFMPYLNRPVSLGMNAFLLRFDTNILNNVFVYYMLLSDSITKEIQKRVKGAVTKTITKDAVREIPVIYPPIEQQNKFAQIVEKVEAQKRKNEQVIEQMDNLFNSISQKAFRGEL